MDKYKKYDENIDIFPDVTIEAVEQIPELSETKIDQDQHSLGERTTTYLTQEHLNQLRKKKKNSRSP